MTGGTCVGGVVVLISSLAVASLVAYFFGHRQHDRVPVGARIRPVVSAALIFVLI